MSSLTTVYFTGILIASLSGIGSAFLGDRIFPLKGGSVVTPIEQPKEEEKPVPVEEEEKPLAVEDEEEKPLQLEDEEEKPLAVQDEDEEKPLMIEDKAGGKKRRRRR
jgi:hypothetical protein